FRRAGTGLCILLLVLGIAATLVARRRAGFLHMARGLIGACGLVFATVPIRVAFANFDLWPDIAKAIGKHQAGPAIETAISHFNKGTPSLAAGCFLASIILLSWQQRRAPVAKEDWTCKNVRSASPSWHCPIRRWNRLGR